MAKHTQNRRQPVRARRRPPDVDLPRFIADAIRKAWPDGVVDKLNDTDDAARWGEYPRLKASLSRVSRSRVLLEREPQSVLDPVEGSDADEDSPHFHEGWRSYWLFFVSPTDERFEFETETIEEDEDGIEGRLSGQGWIGCVLGISIVAPFAAVGLDQLEVFESGSRYDPHVEPHMFTVGGGKLDLESHFREMVDEEGLAILGKL